MFAPRIRTAGRQPTVGAVASALVAFAALGLTACGDDGNAATVTTVAIRPESYEVKPPATVPPATAAAPAPDAEGRSPVEQAHTIGQDEYPYEIAQLFDVDLDELRNWNGWEEDYSNYPGAGGIARIPPGAKFVDPAATSSTEAEAEADTESDDGEATVTASGECTYTLEENDYPVEVAEKFDIELSALLAANGFAMDGAGNVPAWPGAGSTINLPDGPNCTSTATTAAG